MLTITLDSSKAIRPAEQRFNAIDRLFCPLCGDNHPAQKELVSVKKLQQCEAYWSTCMIILGWLLDTIANLGVAFASSRMPPRDSWLHPTLPEADHCQEIAPDSRQALVHVSVLTWFPKTSHESASIAVHVALANFQWLKDHLASRPTRLLDIVELFPSVSGADDASKQGMGGIILQLRNDVPHLWHAPFSKEFLPVTCAWLTLTMLPRSSSKKPTPTLLMCKSARPTRAAPTTPQPSHGNGVVQIPPTRLQPTSCDSRPYINATVTIILPPLTTLEWLVNVMADDCSRLQRLNCLPILTLTVPRNSHGACGLPVPRCFSL
jgi:hypothetical protein